MKNILVALAFLPAVPAFADSFGTTARNRFFCYYRDSRAGYSHGAGGETAGIAKSRALRACQEAVRGGGEGGGSCTFLGCRAIN